MAEAVVPAPSAWHIPPRSVQRVPPGFTLPLPPCGSAYSTQLTLPPN
jgi:hypothetical protein